MTHPIVPSKEFKVRASEANINVNDRFTDEEIEKMRNWLSWHWSDPSAGEIVSRSSLIESYKMSNVLLKELKIHNAKK